MAKIRQDAWSHEDDLLLAETVLRHIRDGSTQLKAFDEVGDKLNRTSAACGFRWNAEVRQQYDQAVALAKRHRKEKKRALAKIGTGNKQNEELDTLSIDLTELEENKKEDYKELFYNENLYMPESTSDLSINMEKEIDQPVSIDSIIASLKKLKTNYNSTKQSAKNNEKLILENTQLKNNKEQLEKKVHELEHKLEVMQEDYQTIIKIMDRARKMVVFDDDNTQVPTFRMEKNGNLEQVAK
ncbi:RsfA family transcriptional regulator [Saliterribacillus persicus]|uniref:Prespore-specific regulator n=1 Tax=Saliterribacillus persicus TaxID=930114 RepID=A0A368XJ00_9BACI|nr:RsfA family transcriptional regulator [Saliterribacillus persicus]RCW66447.1 prespore-specific regulator [Saliterribacillus persicus]